MNFAGHVLVASLTRLSGTIDLQSVTPTDELFLLGSALPDIASMGRVRLQRPLENSALDEGVENHHFADSAFHHSDWFVKRNADLRKEFELAGLARGPSRACAHVGVELFLDGHLLTGTPGLESAAQSCLQRTSDGNLGLETAVKAEREEKWRTHLSRTATWPLPDDYHEPQAVAIKLQRIVAGRPRLAFSSEQLAAVEDVLTANQDWLISESEQLLEEVTGGVREAQSAAN